MNTHDTPGGTTGDPVGDVDRELHRAIHSYATSVQPADRLSGIQARTADAAPDRGRRTWLVAGGSALVAASVVAAAVVLAPSDDQSDDPSGGLTGEAPIAGTPREVTVFALATVGERGRLYPSQVETEDSGSAGVDAVRALLDAEPQGRTNVWATVPDSVDIASVSEASGRVVVDFTGPVDDPWPSQASWAFDPALFSQQLIYTVQAELDTDAPLTVTMDGRPTDTLLTHRVGSKPLEADPAALSPILIDAPEQGATVSSPVTVRGTSDTFEANVVWEVSRDGEVVKQGTTMGGTMFDRRPFRFTVDLPPGSYTLRAFETSAEDGSLVAEDTRTFTVS